MNFEVSPYMARSPKPAYCMHFSSWTNYLVIRIEMSFVLCFPGKTLRSRSVSYISLTLIQTIPRHFDGLAELHG